MILKLQWIGLLVMEGILISHCTWECLWIGKLAKTHGSSGFLSWFIHWDWRKLSLVSISFLPKFCLLFLNDQLFSINLEMQLKDQNIFYQMPACHVVGYIAKSAKHGEMVKIPTEYLYAAAGRGWLQPTNWFRFLCPLYQVCESSTGSIELPQESNAESAWGV